MPAPMLHLTFGALCAEDKDTPPALARAMQADPVYTRLGSIVHDLPYYPNIAKMAMRFAMGLPGLSSPWGYRIHYETPGLLLRNFIERARLQTGLSRDERLALVGGFVSHVALDVSQHPLVVALARRDMAELGGNEDYHHWICEKYHSAFFHSEILGEDILGSRRFREMARLTKHGTVVRARPEPQLIKLVRDAFLDTYGDSPTPREWRRWMTEFRKFGTLASGRVARTDSEKKRTPAMRERYYVGPGFDFMEYYEAATRRFASLSSLVLAYFDAADFSDATRVAFDAEAAVDHLVYPAATAIPVLPPSRTEARPPAPPRPRRLLLRRPRHVDNQADQAA